MKMHDVLSYFIQMQL